ncbi:tatD [Mytilus edulis]|uniref:TatD n=1 Tax=Mytilus edulis TaxID=6550 RepID=A0A8S3PPF4_MYTED|nr:tatD [Mytilus edulis]
MASIERELEYDVREEIELEGNRTVVIMGKEMEVLDEMVEVDPKAPQCLLCPLKARHPARHALDKHLPWYFSPQTACWCCSMQERRLEYHGKEHHTDDERFMWDEDEYGESWVQLMNGLLRELAVLNNVEYPDGLVKHVSEIMADVKTNRNFTEQELSLPDQQHWLKTFEEYKSEAGISLGPLAIKLSGPISIADSHFHLDTLLVRTGCSGFHELSDFGTREYYKTCMMFMVANFCFPSSWPNSSQRTELRKTPSVHFSFGIHPRTVNSSSPSNLHRHLTDLEYLVKSSRTVAIGECGLDTSDRNVNLSKQIEYLEKQLQLAVKNSLPVVIHCRGNDALHLTLLTSLVNCCPKEQKIHWHCFTSSQEIYLTASGHFVNLVFGITPFIFGNRYPNIREIIKENGIDRLVLESDAPYIKYKENQIPNPYIVNFVAEEISKLLNIPVEQVFETTFSKTKIYGKNIWKLRD